MANFSADYHIQKLMAVFTEIIRSGRYSNPETPIETAIDDLQKTASALFDAIESLGRMAGS
jgi:hypothetical protein